MLRHFAGLRFFYADYFSLLRRRAARLHVTLSGRSRCRRCRHHIIATIYVITVTRIRSAT